MNFYQDELTAKYNRQKVRDDFNIIKLEGKASRARIYRHGLFSRTMHTFAGWMISTGKELHERYENPSAHSHKMSKSFAH